MTPTRARRRAAVALILSGIFPGLGQFYNRELFKGLVFLVAGGVLTWLVGRVVPMDPAELVSAPPGTNAIALLCLLLAVWIWSIVDAWRVGGR